MIKLAPGPACLKSGPGAGGLDTANIDKIATYSVSCFNLGGLSPQKPPVAKGQSKNSFTAYTKRVKAALRLTIRVMANGSLHTGSVDCIRVNFLGFDRLPAYVNGYK